MMGAARPAIVTISSNRPADRSLPEPTDRRPTAMPTGLRWLAVGTFAFGTEAFVIAGVLPQIGDDLAVSQSAAGLLVAMFALSYGLSAPIVSAAVARLQPKAVLRLAMALFVVTNLAAAAAPTFSILLGARIVAGIFAAAFAPTAAATASQLVVPAQRGRALALVFGGMSLAMVAGVPLGTVLSNIGSWRTTFVFVAGLGVVAALGIHRFVPEVSRQPEAAKRRPLAVVATPGVARCLFVSVVVRAGDFAVFTYLADIITDLYGNAKVAVPLVLLVNGAAGWYGTVLSGRSTDAHGADHTRRRAITGSAIGLALLWISSVLDGPIGPMVAVPALLIWSTAAWGFGPAQQARLLTLAPHAPTAALAVNTSATQLGIGLGGLVGAATLAHATSASIPAVGAAFTVVAAVIGWNARRPTPPTPLTIDHHDNNTTATTTGKAPR